MRHYLFGRVHPDYQSQGIGNYLMEWAEARARQSLDKAPPEARVSVHTNAVHENRAAHELFQARGYAPTRCFYRMIIEMEPDAPPPEPVWPAGIRVRPYRLGTRRPGCAPDDSRSVQGSLGRGRRRDL